MLWGLLWRSKNKLNGITEHLIYRNCVPLIFRTRKQAREWADTHYGYIRNRPDLRREPHGWRLPKPVKIEISFHVDGLN